MQPGHLAEMYNSAKAGEGSFSKARTGQQERALACLAAICGFLLLACMGGCSGISTSSTSTLSQQAPQISASQNSLSVVTGGTANVTLTVSGTPTPTLACSDGGSGTVQLSGFVMTYTAPNTVPVGGETTIVCNASNTAGSATVSVIAHISAASTPPPTQEAPQISASETIVSVLTGGTANVTLTVSGIPTPNVSCAVSSAGTAQLSGLVMTYTAPNVVPAGGEATIACTASNAAGSATASVTANIFAVIPGYLGPVPSTFFGNTIMESSDWPSIPFGSLGKAPGVQWPYVETSKGNFNWTSLDAFVDEANARGVSFIYTSIYVPPWAAADPSSCFDYAYQTSVCTSTVTNIVDWQNFVTALVTRYKGRIQVYELWNEPSCTCTFTGTVAQLAALTQAEHDIIRSIDPAALIIGPTMQGYESAYLASYFAAGGTTDIDAVTMHSSPNPDNDNAEFMMGSVTTGIQSVMKEYGLSSKPLWNTENDWGNNDSLTDPDAQAAFVARDLLLNWNVGITRVYWYAWDNSTVGTLWSPTSGLAEAGSAYAQVESWMNGATIAPCSLNGSTNIYQALYTCDLTLSTGNQAQAVWYTNGSESYTAPSQFTQYLDLAGHIHSIPSNQQVTAGAKPILLEAPAP
jgi:polysaccharide biosynthesis protein PslG